MFKEKKVFAFTWSSKVMTGFLVLAGLVFLFTLVTNIEGVELNPAPEVEIPGEVGILVASAAPPQQITSCDSALLKARSACGSAKSSCGKAKAFCEDYNKCKSALAQCTSFLPPNNKTKCDDLNKCFREKGFTCNYKWEWEDNKFICKGSIFCPYAPSWDNCPSNVACGWQRECSRYVDKCKAAVEAYRRMNCAPSQHTLQDLSIPEIPEKFTCSGLPCF